MKKTIFAALFLLFATPIYSQPSDEALNNPMLAVSSSGNKQLNGTTKELLEYLSKANNSARWEHGTHDTEWNLRTSRKDTVKNKVFESVWTFRILSDSGIGKSALLLEHLAVDGKTVDSTMLWTAVNLIFNAVKSNPAIAGTIAREENPRPKKAKQDTAAERFLITDEAFNAQGEGSGTDVDIVEVTETGFKVNAKSIAIGAGRINLWCNGAKHTWIGTLTYKGYTFKSDKEDPLQFEVKEGRGYAYLRGKGIVAFPNGKKVVLPPPPKK
jgi:hypothetical protein